MPKLSESGKAEVRATMQNLKIGSLRGLSIVASRVILNEVLSDINFDQRITLKQLTKDGRLNLNYSEIERNNVFYQPDLALNRCEINDWLNRRYLFGRNVSEDSARNFLKGKNVREDTCKYFCKGLQIVYTKVIESDNLLNPVQIALTEFDHTQQLQDFEQKVRYKKTIPLFCQINKDGYLPLKWLLLRCLNHNYNGNNYQTLFIKFSLSTTTVLADERTALQYLKQELIKCLNSKVCPPFQPSTKLSEIGKILARDILFKQNIVLVFDGKFQQNIMIKFWKILIKYLQIALTETDHCLLLLVVDDCPHNNYQYFQQINIKQEFSRDELLLWLNNQRVKQLLNLQNEEELIATTNIIWQNSQTGQPEALLQAIYQQFNYNKWDEEKDQWYSLSN